MIPTLEWIDSERTIKMIDQTQLPHNLEFLKIKDYRDVVHAIKVMQVRGAPAIGVSTAMGLALASIEFCNLPSNQFMTKMEKAAEILRSTRPTAVNLFWAIERIRGLIQIENERGASSLEISKKIISEAKKMAKEDVETNLSIGKNGADLLEDGDNILTHCNAGSLGTVQHGTAFSARFQ